jgi:opacity protein-like surface antigen
LQTAPSCEGKGKAEEFIYRIIVGAIMRNIRGIVYAALAVSAAAISISTSAAAPVQTSTISGYYNNTFTFGFSGAFNHSDTDFRGVGSASDTTGLICADGTVNVWDSALRYAGEFAGFRIAAAGSLCQGFGTASERVGGFDGRTQLGTFMSGGGRLIVPVNLGNGMMIMPHAGAGIGFGNIKVEAAPFESDRSWRSGFYWEAGVAIPLVNFGVGAAQRNFGTGAVQNIDAAATELYLNYKRWDAGDQTLNGGARTDTTFEMYTAGVRVKF